MSQNASVDGHYLAEKTCYLPWLEEKLGAGSSEGLQAFEAPFKTFEELVASIRDKKAPFMPEEFRAAIHGFLPLLIDHVKLKVETLRVDKVKHIPEAEMQKMESDTEAIITKHSNFTTSAQACVVNGDGRYGLW